MYIYTMYMQEPSGRCLKTVVISVNGKEINSGPWKNISVDAQASLLHPLPLPLGGLVAIGYQTIAYYNKDIQHAIDPPIIKVRAQTAAVVHCVHIHVHLHVSGLCMYTYIVMCEVQTHYQF